MMETSTIVQNIIKEQRGSAKIYCFLYKKKACITEVNEMNMTPPPFPPLQHQFFISNLYQKYQTRMNINVWLLPDSAAKKRTDIF